MQKLVASYAMPFVAITVFMAAPATGGEGSLQRGQPISQVRAQLIRDGWTPVRIDKILPVEERINPEVKERKNLEGDARDMFNAGFYEVEKCIGADFNECTFNYQKNGECLRLKTEGEYAGGRGEPTLFSWTNDCPD
ncbi:MAG TPA: hypothetical protein VFW28_08090 [Micropepsaceae bacterium]|nr:hypothetical protein [Micropepsaceae bacterium]